MKNLPFYRQTKYPDLFAALTYKNLPDGKTRVTAIPIHQDQSRWSELAPYTTKPVTPSRLASAEAEAIARLVAAYENLYGTDVITADDIVKVVEAINNDVKSNNLRLRTTWAATSTNLMALLFFERNTLEQLKPYLVTSQRKQFFDSDRQSIEDNLTSICARHCGGDLDKAREAAQKHLAEADIILDHIRTRCPVPDIKLSRDFIVRADRDEQIKMLSLTVLATVYDTLPKDYLPSKPKIVFFAVLCIFGLRPAEAAGTLPCDILFFEDYCVVDVKHQEVDGLRSTRMKNPYSPRKVIIPLWGKTLLKQCVDLIGTNYPTDGTAMLKSADVAPLVKALLLKCGADEGEIKQVANTITSDDLDTASCDPSKRAESEQDKERKIACYVLRRCFATIMRTFMGFSLYQTDRMLGHIPAGLGGRKEAKHLNDDLSSPETQARLAAQMERYVFSPDISLNPAYTPIALSTDQRIDLIAFSEYVFRAEENCVVELNLDAVETGESVSIILAPQNDVDYLEHMHASSLPKNWSEIQRNMIGNTSTFFKDSDDNTG